MSQIVLISHIVIGISFFVSSGFVVKHSLHKNKNIITLSLKTFSASLLLLIISGCVLLAQNSMFTFSEACNNFFSYIAYSFFIYSVPAVLAIVQPNKKTVR